MCNISQCVNNYNDISVIQVFILQVRGAPLIGIVAALSLAVELRTMTFETPDQLFQHVTKQLEYLVTSRPTAVSISDVNDQLLAKLLADVSSQKIPLEEIQERYVVIKCRWSTVVVVEMFLANKILLCHNITHIYW